MNEIVQNQWANSFKYLVLLYDLIRVETFIDSLLNLSDRTLRIQVNKHPVDSKERIFEVKCNGRRLFRNNRFHTCPTAIEIFGKMKAIFQAHGPFETNIRNSIV
ncbi:hypothetical protein SNEBB_002498 [Seison nebaliae]|nr:hypothetical protein SNEBB_002498 [Seison nebaliae]